MKAAAGALLDDKLADLRSLENRFFWLRHMLR